MRRPIAADQSGAGPPHSKELTILSELLKFIGHQLSQEPICQSAVYRNDVTGSLRQTLRNQQKDCFSLVLRLDEQI